MWNYLPLVEMSSLGENASTLLREFLARNKIAVGFRPGEKVEDKVIERWHGSSADSKGVVRIRPALGRGLTHDNVADLKAVVNEIGELAKRDLRVVLLDVTASTAKAIAVAADLVFVPTKVVDEKLDVVTSEHDSPDRDA